MDDIKICLEDMMCKDVGKIVLALDGLQYRTAVKVLITFRDT
jgi:hypothetical protein